MRKTKATPSTIPAYYQFRRVEIKIGYTAYKGYYYWLDKPMTNADEIELMSKHGNIRVFWGRTEYAPELRATVLFVADKNLQPSDCSDIRRERA